MHLNRHVILMNSFIHCSVVKEPTKSDVAETKAAPAGKFGSIALYSDSSDEETDSESADEEEGNTDLRKYREEEAEKETAGKKVVTAIPTKVSKKEKGLLKEDDLDNLDDILNEFGIDVQAQKDKTNAETISANDITTDVIEDEEDKLGKKKKKKKKKKQPDVDITNEAVVIASASEEAIPTPSTIDVAAVLKSKVPAKKKSAAEVAAANAAKEAKAKKEAEVKKKKKKKDKFLHGAVQR